MELPLHCMRDVHIIATQSWNCRWHLSTGIASHLFKLQGHQEAPDASKVCKCPPAARLPDGTWPDS